LQLVFVNRQIVSFELSKTNTTRLANMKSMNIPSISTSPSGIVFQHRQPSLFDHGPSELADDADFSL